MNMFQQTPEVGFVPALNSGNLTKHLTEPGRTRPTTAGHPGNPILERACVGQFSFPVAKHLQQSLRTMPIQVPLKCDLLSLFDATTAFIVVFQSSLKLNAGRFGIRELVNAFAEQPCHLRTWLTGQQRSVAESGTSKTRGFGDAVPSGAERKTLRTTRESA